MIAQELRVGNLIIANGLYEGKIVTVDQIGASGTLNDDKRVILFKGEHVGEFVSDCVGIPLSEDWLRRLGFEQDQTDTMCHKNKYCWIYLFDNGTFELEFITGDDRFNLWRQYNAHVHILQNLFFAMTGEELKLKEE